MTEKCVRVKLYSFCTAQSSAVLLLKISVTTDQACEKHLDHQYSLADYTSPDHVALRTQDLPSLTPTQAALLSSLPPQTSSLQSQPEFHSESEGEEDTDWRIVSLHSWAEVADMYVSGAEDDAGGG